LISIASAGFSILTAPILLLERLIDWEFGERIWLNRKIGTERERQTDRQRKTNIRKGDVRRDFSSHLSLCLCPDLPIQPNSPSKFPIN
jgi:hypothetical protein